MLKKAVLVVSGNALGSILTLLRNLVVARLVSPENYGIASAFAICMSIVEMLSYIGLNQLMVVDKDGDDPSFQSAMHGFQILRGSFSTVTMFLIANYFAAFMGFAEVGWAFQVLALIPLMNAFQHYDVHRLRRHLNFMPSTLSSVVPPLVSVLSLWPVALIYADYRIMLIGIFVQTIATVILSHVTAERPYRARLDFGLMKKAMAFGWPLLLNGVLIFGVLNGEKLIVGRELGVVQFAFFSMAFTLTMTPTLVLANSCQSLFLPLLSNALKSSKEAFERLCTTSVETGLVIAVLLMLGTSLVGGPLTHLLTGSKYVPIIPLLVPMAVLHAVKVAKTGNSIIVLAIAKTWISAIGNLLRVASLPLSLWVAIVQHDVLAIIWVGTAAELIGFVVVTVLTARKTKSSLAPLMLPVALTTLTAVAITVDAYYYPPQTGLVANAHWSQILVALIGIAALASMRECLRFVRQRIGARG